MNRSVRISIKIREGIKEELKVYAEQYGLPLSTLTAYILGEWLHIEKEKIKSINNINIKEKACPPQLP